MPKAMIQDIKFLTARRSYEFRPDDLRLSALCTEPVGARLERIFHFRTSAMGAPAPMFGDVPATYPPGYVFDMGFVASPQGDLVPIRFIHFEAQRIVIDVAGKSSAIALIYDMVREAIADLVTSDGSPLIGEHPAARDYSELTARCNFPLDQVLSPRLRKLYNQTFGTDETGGTELVPSLTVHTHRADEAFGAVQPVFGFSFAIRAGTRPDEHICFSGAPLDSDAHQAFLTEFVRNISD